jgi:hypothetical protein
VAGLGLEKADAGQKGLALGLEDVVGHLRVDAVQPPHIPTQHAALQALS